MNLKLVSSTISMLSADTVELANSGHPGMPMGMSDIASVLFLKHLNFNPAEPEWINRDRFVLSNGHGSALLYSLLHLSGYDITLDDLRAFRQLNSKTAGHPENHTVGVECTTGPLGQGLANAVGLALGEKIMAAYYNTANNKIFDHKVYCFVGDGCLMEGITSEASSLAGHLKLDNLIVLYDNNNITIAGNTNITFTENVLKRYESYDWFVQSCDGHNFDEINRAIENAKNEKNRPSFISLKTTIGYGSPNKANSPNVHGSPLGKDEIAATKRALGFPENSMHHIPKEAKETFAMRKKELLAKYNKWEINFAKWQADNPDLSEQLIAQLELKADNAFESALIEQAEKIEKAESTRKLSEIMLQIVAKHVPALIGGSADLDPSTLTYLKDYGNIQPGNYTGKNISYGVREHAMGAIINGLSYYGGFIPFGSTFLVFSDYMRPAIRVAALSDLPSLFIFTHDSVLLGEDGPTHQPIEHINSLRMIPNVKLYRPADALETALCYYLAIENKKSPNVMVLSRQALPLLQHDSNDVESIKNGAYILWESKPKEKPEIVFIATGSEVALAIDAGKKIAEELRINIRIVSMPCCEIFKMQNKEFKTNLLPEDAKIVTLEAGSTFGWREIVDENGTRKILSLGIDTFGASAPQSALAKKFGLTTTNVVEKVMEWYKI